MRCKIFGHKWKYGIFEYVENLCEYSRNNIISTQDKTCTQRICERCNKKQINFESYSDTWRDAEWSKSDIRNNKLEKLGI